MAAITLACCPPIFGGVGNSKSIFGFTSTRVPCLGGNMHKVTGITILLALLLTPGLIMPGCGSGTASPGSSNINGTWAATLKDADGSTAYQFSATFAQGSGSNLSITNLMFTNPGPCLLSGGSGAGGSFTPTNGAFELKMASADVGGPLVSLQGTLVNGGISGTWSATGLIPPCSGNGTFAIQRSMAG
jgi:hypothetical protein